MMFNILQLAFSVKQEIIEYIHEIMESKAISNIIHHY